MDPPENGECTKRASSTSPATASPLCSHTSRVQVAISTGGQLTRMVSTSSKLSTGLWLRTPSKELISTRKLTPRTLYTEDTAWEPLAQSKARTPELMIKESNLL